jgi:hypothetical protein
MSDGLDAMTGVLGTVLVAGVAMKMANSLFPSPAPQQRPQRVQRVATRRNQRGRRLIQDRSTFNHPGIFGNVGF